MICFVLFANAVIEHGRFCDLVPLIWIAGKMYATCETAVWIVSFTDQFAC